MLQAVLFALVAGVPAPTAQVRDAGPPIVQTIGTASIVGRVTILVNGQPTPILRAQVTLFGAVDGQPQPTDTDIEGRFRFDQLAAGTYRVTVEKAGFVPVLTGARRAFDPPAPFALGAGLTLSIDFSVQPGAAIEGRLTDSRGGPLVNMIVSASRLVYGPYGKQPTAVRQATTDDQGRFRVHTLPAGDYYVEAALDPRAPSTMQPGPGERPMTLARTYYPGTARLVEARVITLSTGQDFDAADFSIERVPSVRVAGRVVDSAGSKPSVMTVRLQGVGAPPGQVIGFVAPAGLDLAGDPGMPSTRVEFLFSQVPPGEYWLLAASVSEPGAAPEFAAERVTVLDRDLPDIVVTTGKAVTITGRVEVEEGGSPPPNLQVLATPWDYELPALPGQPAEGAAVNVRADGTFTLSNVFGPRVLQLAHVPAGWAMDHVWLGDVGIIDLPMELPSSAHPTIFVTRRLGSVDGEVQDNQGHPFASARVIIFGQDERRWGFRSRLIKSGLCGPDGRFVVDDLLPGEYLVAAMEYLEEGSWMNPDVLAALRSSAVAMRVSAGSPLSVTLKLR